MLAHTSTRQRGAVEEGRVFALQKPQFNMRSSCLYQTPAHNPSGITINPHPGLTFKNKKRGGEQAPGRHLCVRPHFWQSSTQTRHRADTEMPSGFRKSNSGSQLSFLKKPRLIFTLQQEIPHYQPQKKKTKYKVKIIFN